MALAFAFGYVITNSSIVRAQGDARLWIDTLGTPSITAKDGYNLVIANEDDDDIEIVQNGAVTWTFDGATGNLTPASGGVVRDVVVSVPAFNGAAGATATVGWVVTGADKGLATLAQSATADTLVIPISGLLEGDVISAFTVRGQLESGGNTATVDADLRKLTPAAGGTADASIGAITQISKTADYEIDDSKTLAASETIASGETLYLLVTATTAAATDIELSAIELTVQRSS